MFNFFKCAISITNKLSICISMPKRVRNPDVRIKHRRKLNTGVPVKKVKIETTTKSALNLSTKTMSLNSKIEVLCTPVKSANDKKDYK